MKSAHRWLNACIAVLCFGIGLGIGQQPAPPQLAPIGPLTFPPIEGECQVLCLRNHDGDTVTFAFLVQATGRLYGINAPELSQKPAGPASRDALAKLLPTGPTRAVLKGKEKFGR